MLYIKELPKYELFSHQKFENKNFPSKAVRNHSSFRKKNTYLGIFVTFKLLELFLFGLESILFKIIFVKTCHILCVI